MNTFWPEIKVFEVRYHHFSLGNVIYAPKNAYFPPRAGERIEFMGLSVYTRVEQLLWTIVAYFHDIKCFGSTIVI